MGWDNPPVPWREFERRLSWRQSQAADSPDSGPEVDGPAVAGPEVDGPAVAGPEVDGPEVGGPEVEFPEADDPEAESPEVETTAADDAEESGNGQVRPTTRLPTASRKRPRGLSAVPVPRERPVPWAELHCHTSYSFLDGASSPDDLIAEAARQELTAIAITDHDGMYGVPQFAQAAARFRANAAAAASGTTVTSSTTAASDTPADSTERDRAAERDRAGREHGVATVFGAELSLDIPPRSSRAALADIQLAGIQGTPRAGMPDPVGRHLLVLARDPDGYRRLCEVISAAHLAGGEKGRPVYDLRALAEAHGGHWVILTGCRKGTVPAALPRAADLPRTAALPGTADMPQAAALPRTAALARTAALPRTAVLPGAADMPQAADLPRTAALARTAALPRAADLALAADLAQAAALAQTAAGRGLRPADPDPLTAAAAELRLLTDMFGRDNVMVELIGHDQPDDDERNDALFELARREGLGVIATNNVHHATPADARMAQVLAAIRARSSLDDMDGWLAAAGAAYIRSGAEMARRLRRYPGVLERTVELAAECAFDFTVIAPKLPDYPVPEGHDEMSWLRALVARKAPGRYGPPGTERIPGAYRQIAHELDVIAQLGFAGYFLIVHDIVQFCNDERILCQGRGSAANSAVCFALGITSVDPVMHGLLFERFLSAGRDGPPDIDLDIEHRRREEVIQYVYRAYGRGKAAQVANVIAYRPRMAIRDAGRVLGYSPEDQNRWSRQVGPRAYGPGQPLPPDAGVPEPVIELAERMQRLPRHLGIHSGGMVICDRPVAQVCPVEWARMPNRSVLQWDKDDCAYAGLVKFDLLGLGMLTALRDCFDLVEAYHGVRWDLHSLPQEDPGVYDMLCEADTVGVFQVESRAQMATLPRLRPRQFYDLVVEVALIRPGPIQGGSVHPYMRRRHGDEPPCLPHPLMEPALGKTLGVPLFQEQMMQIAIDCAGFSASEADRLRQAMSSKRAPERIEELHSRLIGGMGERGIPVDVAQDIYEKILAFSSYGFPESHAISFAYLVYASAWLKCYYPAAFTAALLRAQPMGFYSPASLISDVRRHGVQVRGVDVNASGVLAVLEPEAVPTGGQPVPGQPAIRIGLSEVRNLGSDAAAAIVAGQPYADLEDFARRTALPRPALEALATAGAFGCFGLSRREALWAAGAAATIDGGQLPGTTVGLTAPVLSAMTPAEVTFADLWATGTYGTHPIEHIRAMLAADGVRPAADLREATDGTMITVGGLVTHRQQPGTARGVVFLSLEDETGMANVICPPAVWQRFRKIGVESSALLVFGKVERLDGAVSLLAVGLRKLRVVAAARSRDFR